MAALLRMWLPCWVLICSVSDPAVAIPGRDPGATSLPASEA
jgi:hypothetical protein